MNDTSIDSPLNDIRIGQVVEHWASAQNIPCTYTEKTDSTNLKAKAEAFIESVVAENIVIYACDEQSSGRGRGQNTWTNAQPGSQLLTTWSFALTEVSQPITSPLIGLALYRAAWATWPFLKWNLKAPNDLYIGDKKVAGLLLETLSQGDDHRLLVGLGLNILDFPRSITSATSIVHSLPKSSPLLAQDFISFLERLIFEFSFALQSSYEGLNSTASASLMKALNDHPLLTEKYIDLDGQGNLKTESKTIAWQSL